MSRVQNCFALHPNPKEKRRKPLPSCSLWPFLALESCLNTAGAGVWYDGQGRGDKAKTLATLGPRTVKNKEAEF